MAEDGKEAAIATKRYTEFVEGSKYKDQLGQIVPAYITIVKQLPELRDSPEMMRAEVKSESPDGIQDVVTEADKYIQNEIKKNILGDKNWQFWGEEGEAQVLELNQEQEFTLITDPIEGTNNFRARKDAQWGSVLSLVDNKSGEPVIGLVAHPTENTIYLGVKGGGAYKLKYDSDGNLSSFNKLSPVQENQEFTYNNSPHFEEELRKRVEKFFELGKVEKSETSDKLENSRKKIVIKEHDAETVFLDPESGALEAVTHRGTIYFKTSNEMAAVFVILTELGGKVTDANGKPWHLGINTLVAARNEQDYDYLKSLYNKTK